MDSYPLCWPTNHTGARLVLLLVLVMAENWIDPWHELSAEYIQSANLELNVFHRYLQEWIISTRAFHHSHPFHHCTVSKLFFACFCYILGSIHLSTAIRFLLPYFHCSHCWWWWWWCWRWSHYENVFIIVTLSEMDNNMGRNEVTSSSSTVAWRMKSGLIISQTEFLWTANKEVEEVEEEAWRGWIYWYKLGYHGYYLSIFITRNIYFK